LENQWFPGLSWRHPFSAPLDTTPHYRTAIYARVSTSDRQETLNQLRELRELCARDSQLELVGEYTDQESGRSGQRDAFRRLFADAHQRRFDLVLFWSLDRFSREGALATLNYLQQLESYGVGFRSFTERYLDSTGVFKEAIIAILATLAKQESMRLSERVKAGMARARAEGKHVGRAALDPVLRERIQKLAAADTPKAAIARTLRIDRATVQKYLNRRGA
jgi:DNA invertase Pin-like site-specific DNA recombinase